MNHKYSLCTQSVAILYNLLHSIYRSECWPSWSRTTFVKLRLCSAMLRFGSSVQCHASLKTTPITGARMLGPANEHTATNNSEFVPPSLLYVLPSITEIPWRCKRALDSIELATGVGPDNVHALGVSIVSQTYHWCAETYCCLHDTLYFVAQTAFATF